MYSGLPLFQTSIWDKSKQCPGCPRWICTHLGYLKEPGICILGYWIRGVPLCTQASKHAQSHKQMHTHIHVYTYGISITGCTPLVFVQSKDTSVTAKSTSKAAICSLSMSKCLIRNSCASSGSWTTVREVSKMTTMDVQM